MRSFHTLFVSVVLGTIATCRSDRGFNSLIAWVGDAPRILSTSMALPLCSGLQTWGFQATGSSLQGSNQLIMRSKRGDRAEEREEVKKQRSRNWERNQAGGPTTPDGSKRKEFDRKDWWNPMGTQSFGSGDREQRVASSKRRDGGSQRTGSGGRRDRSGGRDKRAHGSDQIDPESFGDLGGRDRKQRSQFSDFAERYGSNENSQRPQTNGAQDPRKLLSGRQTREPKHSPFTEDSTWRGATGRGKKTHFNFLDKYIRRIDALLPEEMEHLVRPLSYKPNQEQTSRTLKITFPESFVEPGNITEGDVRAFLQPLQPEHLALGWHGLDGQGNEEVYIRFGSNEDCQQGRLLDNKMLGVHRAKVRYSVDNKFRRVCEDLGIWAPSASSPRLQATAEDTIEVEVEED